MLEKVNILLKVVKIVPNNNWSAALKKLLMIELVFFLLVPYNSNHNLFLIVIFKVRLVLYEL